MSMPSHSRLSLVCDTLRLSQLLEELATAEGELAAREAEYRAQGQEVNRHRREMNDFHFKAEEAWETGMMAIIENPPPESQKLIDCLDEMRVSFIVYWEDHESPPTTLSVEVRDSDPKGNVTFRPTTVVFRGVKFSEEVRRLVETRNRNLTAYEAANKKHSALSLGCEETGRKVEWARHNISRLKAEIEKERS